MELMMGAALAVIFIIGLVFAVEAYE